MNGWQAALYNIVFVEQLVEPKRVAARLHRHPDYLSDICRRERTDPLAVFNAILQESERCARTDPARMLTIANAVFGQLTIGTRFYPNWASAVPAGDLGDLRDQISVLLNSLSGAVDALCDIERDGRVTQDDDPQIAAFDVQATRLGQLLAQLQQTLHARRAATAAGGP